MLTATTDSDDDANAAPAYDYVNSSQFARTSRAVRKKLQEKLNWLQTFMETEMWGIFVSLVMQDGPFVVMRLIALVAFRIITYTNYFFTAKNALILTLQVYRMIAIYGEHRKRKKERERDRKILQLSKLYVNAFQMRNKTAASVHDDAIA